MLKRENLNGAKASWIWESFKKTIFVQTYGIETTMPYFSLSSLLIPSPETSSIVPFSNSISA
jgi:hypothetical protein